MIAYTYSAQQGRSAARPETIQRKSWTAAIVIGAALLAFCRPAAGATASPTSLADLGRSIERTVELEQDSIQRYREQLDELRKLRAAHAAAVKAYQVQFSTYGNLLLSPMVEIETIETAWTEMRATRAGLEAQIEELARRKEEIAAEKAATDRQRELVDSQIGELRKLPGKNEETAALLRQAERLDALLSEKASLLAQLQKRYETRYAQLDSVVRSIADLSTRFEEQAAQKRSRHLFERRRSPLSTEAWDRLVQEGAALVRGFRAFFRPGFWVEEAGQLWQAAGLVLVSFSVLLVVLIILVIRIRRGLAALETHSVRERLGPWHLFVLRLVGRSLTLTAVTVFVYLCSFLDVFYLSTPSIRLLFHLLLAALITRWARISLSFWEEQSRLSTASADRLRRLALAIRYFAWLHMLLQWVLGPAAGLLLVVRIGFEIGLMLWLARFWRFLEERRGEKEAAANFQRLRYLIVAGKGVGYAATGAALLMDMVGYGALSVYWLSSWGSSLAVLLWWAVLFFLLREWDRYYREKSSSERDELLHDEYPVQWLVIRFCQLLWLISLGVALILAWGGRQVVLIGIYQGLGRSLEVGSMKFSLLGLIYAVFVLLATQAVSRLWRWIFQNKFLARSGMEVGLQDSITTITVYVIWVLGILVALHVFGLNTASLAVAFGALGIGLGFGLQNIFNNFISGIILLFERPIQVGDDVEINGIWATVRKINVRSTVVQTYDNASLIIPNADFVSSQVTNWSFKDKRLRRNIFVGVSYGSNVTRVRDTLLEIADKTPKVLKHPVPDVLFTDFGDNALIFRLRIWTDIDNMLAVETAIRFEIDRLFRERGIKIALPQRDLHIRSWAPEAKISSEKEKAGAGKKHETEADDTGPQEG